MDVKQKIYKLMDERKWTTYMLAEKANLTQSTVSSLFRNDRMPSIQTLEKLCVAFGITLADFFADEDADDEGRVLAARINCLPERRKKIAKALVEEFEAK